MLPNRHANTHSHSIWLISPKQTTTPVFLRRRQRSHYTLGLWRMWSISTMTSRTAGNVICAVTVTRRGQVEMLKCVLYVASLEVILQNLPQVRNLFHPHAPPRHFHPRSHVRHAPFSILLRPRLARFAVLPYPECAPEQRPHPRPSDPYPTPNPA